MSLTGPSTFVPLEILITLLMYIIDNFFFSSHTPSLVPFQFPDNLLSSSLNSRSSPER